LKERLDPSDFRILTFILASILIYWLFYGTIFYFFAISAPLIGIVFIAAIHLFVVLGSLLLITHVRRRFLRLSSYLQDERVPIEELSEKILIPPEKIRSAIKEFRKQGIISGVLDADKNVYLNFAQWDAVEDLLIEHKKIFIEDLAKHFEVSKSEAKFILLEIQNQKMVQGYFIEENREFITQEWIYDMIRASLEKQGRITLNKAKHRLGLTDDAFQHEFNNFIQFENVSGFYFGKNEFVRFEENVEDTFLEAIKTAGSILLKDLSAKFNLSEDYCIYLITEYRSKRLLNGVFSEDKRLFITLDALREYVISAIQHDGSLMLFAKDFAIPHDVLYTTVIRNFNFEDLIKRTGVTRDALENILNRLLTEKGE
jgi:hypothetical protein